MAEYNRRKSEQEAEERRAARRTHKFPYTKIQESAEELEAISQPMKNKGALEKFSDQQSYGYKVERLVQNNPPGQIHKGRITKVNEDLLSIG
jgi:hypothetical protein